MAKEKQHVFSARTTKEGLRLLNGIRKERGIGWDDLVIDAVCERYGLDRLVVALPKAYKPEKKQEVTKGKRKGKGAKARKPKATKESKLSAEEAAEEPPAQQA
jgi:hypothetical protein